jgi:aminoglycoside phosphotransferase (APT) family kinase protein
VNGDISSVAARFRFEGAYAGADALDDGHIHRTFVVRCGDPRAHRRYLLQEMNRHVFPDPAGLMENIVRVTAHLRTKIRAAGGDPGRGTLTVVPTVTGGSFHRENDGECWRAYEFIEGATAHERPEDPDRVMAAARALGAFLRMLADFPAATLHEVLPGFHDTPRRFSAFVEAVHRDAAGRAAGVRAEIRFFEERAEQTDLVMRLLRTGQIPLRVTHNDAKSSNVLLDDRTGEGVCVVDLDTVMPGSALFDFADAVRAGAATAAEDEPDSSRAGLSLPVFEALARGYMEEARGFLTATEIDHLAFSARLITLEQGMRFLGDYLDGDIYYRVRREGQNLDRCRTQVVMVQDMERRFDRMQGIVDSCR